jgi:glycosyltransferase involved in cell wall biosynthesis
MDATSPLVSIVTPSLNQGRFLKRTIDSVLRQDYPQIEYCVIDGGSHDVSIDVLRSYGDRFYWHSQRDNGQSDAINQGMRRSHGDILAYLNSDDVLMPGAVSAVVKHFGNHPEWDLIYGNAQNINADDSVINDYPAAAYSFDKLLQTCCICQPATFWRRRVMDKIGLFDEALHFAMDYEYWLRLGRGGGKLVHVPEFLACSRIYPETKTQSARLEVFREILDVSRRHAKDASFDQYCAYWGHRCHERTTGWPRLLRWVPQCHALLATLHRRWYALAH